MFRRPTPGLFIGFLFTLGCLLALGTWQVEKAPRKAALMETMAERTTAPPITLAEAIRDPEAARYRRIVLRGEFQHDLEAFASAPKHRGAVGRDLVVPFRLAAVPDGSSQATVLVKRGWVPLNTLAGIARPEGARDLAGYVMLASKPTGWGSVFLPDDRPAARYWIRVDIDGMAETLGVPDALPFYVLAAPIDERSIPFGREPTVITENPHWSYAATWFGLALTLIVMFAIFHIKRDRPDA